MAVQATITFKARTPGIYPVERTLKLTPDDSMIVIGRASKSVSKGLVGATDNAWFDSPVVSRTHAQIFLDTDDMVIKIQDTNSMHGTRLNGAELRPRTPATLSSNDCLLFGTEVRRGSEIFPACCFKVTYEIHPWTSQARNTIKFPESSDVEDEDDDYNSGEEVESGGDETPVESPQTKVSIATVSIDLTRGSEESSAPTNLNSLLDGLGVEEDVTAPDVNPVPKADGQPDHPVLIVDDSESFSDQDVDDDDINANLEDYKSDSQEDIEGPYDITEGVFTQVDTDTVPASKTAQSAPRQLEMTGVDYDEFECYVEKILPSYYSSSSCAASTKFTVDPSSVYQIADDPSETDNDLANRPSKEEYCKARLENRAFFIENDAEKSPSSDRFASLSNQGIYGSPPHHQELSSALTPGRQLVTRSTTDFQGSRSAPVNVDQYNCTTPLKSQEIRREFQFLSGTATSPISCDSVVDVEGISASPDTVPKGPCPAGRVSITISDIVDAPVFKSTMDAPSSSCKKRKHDDFREVLEEEVRVWASSSSSYLDSAVSQGVDSQGVDSRGVSDDRIVSSGSGEALAVPQQPSTKRIKRFAEAVGYAALGGVAVGAGLFSILVATAPDFL